MSLVAYSTPQVVYDEIIPAFTKTAAGEGVGFKTLLRRLAATRAARSRPGSRPTSSRSPIEPDMTRLVKADLVAADWNERRTRAWSRTSLVSFIVRKGNPKHIKTWDDLLKPGIKVLTPNPFTSGAAKWNLLAAYGQAADGGKDPQAGLDYVRKLLTKPRRGAGQVRP